MEESQMRKRKADVPDSGTKAQHEHDASKRSKVGTNPAHGRKQHGSEGRWKTPQHAAKHAARVESGHTLDVGHQGIWVTCTRGLEGRAISELMPLCIEYGKELWGIPSQSGDAERKEEETPTGSDAAAADDIEATIHKELEGMKPSNQSRSRDTFIPIRTAVECVFFMRTRAPVEPTELAVRICSDAGQVRSLLDRRCRHINKLTPATLVDRATENGIAKLAKLVLGPHFRLKDQGEQQQRQEPGQQAGAVAAEGHREENQESERSHMKLTGQGQPDEVTIEGKGEKHPGEVIKEDESANQPSAEAKEGENEKKQTGKVSMEGESEARPGDLCSYAIRHTIRHHSTFTSQTIIKMVANLITTQHKVNLTEPDKIILIDIYQLFCSMAVVDGPEYAKLRKLNLNEIYKQGAASAGDEPQT